jgi:hypothetical protein
MGKVIRENTWNLQMVERANSRTSRLFSSSGWRICKVPISYAGRIYAEGKKITWKDGLSALYDYFRATGLVVTNAIHREAVITPIQRNREKPPTSFASRGMIEAPSHLTALRSTIE